MESERTYSSTEVNVRKFSAGVSDGTMNSEVFDGFVNAGAQNESNEQEDSVKDKENTKPIDINEKMEALKSKISNVRAHRLSGEEDLRDSIKRLKQECLDLLIRLLFPEIVDGSPKTKCEDALDLKAAVSENMQRPVSSMLHYTYKGVHYFEENESTSFSAKGLVKCADGREIDFGINLKMSRSFSEYYENEIGSMDIPLTDPLVINFDGNLTEVSDQTFFFDIDSDGVEDEISRLIGNSGFLALDLNEDGKINDGSELFGTKSGNGFKDLAQYDSDKDGWIDEDDEIFEKLRIWSIDENGDSTLYTLKEKGVGAICLQNTSTNFSLNNLSDNSTNAVIRNSGVFLYENGNVGTVQQVDFARNKQKLAAYA